MARYDASTLRVLISFGPRGEVWSLTVLELCPFFEEGHEEDDDWAEQWLSPNPYIGIWTLRCSTPQASF